MLTIVGLNRQPGTAATHKNRGQLKQQQTMLHDDDNVWMSGWGGGTMAVAVTVGLLVKSVSLGLNIPECYLVILANYRTL